MTNHKATTTTTDRTSPHSRVLTIRTLFLWKLFVNSFILWVGVCIRDCFCLSNRLKRVCLYISSEDNRGLVRVEPVWDATNKSAICVNIIFVVVVILSVVSVVVEICYTLFRWLIDWLNECWEERSFLVLFLFLFFFGFDFLKLWEPRRRK
jgi:sterol desaturase/sphingolipid hydroxylase (fatty acid hydroxylase superfamily)